MKFFNRKKIDNTNYSILSLSDIAIKIKNDWKELSEEKNQYSLELVEAMQTLNSIDDNYCFDSGLEMVSQFVSNSRGWNTYTAKKIKEELKRRIIEYNKKRK